MIKRRWSIGLAATLITGGAVGGEVIPAGVAALQEAVTRQCVSVVSTGGSPFRVVGPGGDVISTHTLQHTATARAANEALERPGEVIQVEQDLRLRVAVDPRCVAPTPEAPPPELWPDSLSLSPDTLDLRVGEEGEFSVTWWYTIPQESEMGSRPFRCIEGLGLMEIDPETHEPLAAGHLFRFRQGSCSELERGEMAVTPTAPGAPAGAEA